MKETSGWKAFDGLMFQLENKNLYRAIWKVQRCDDLILAKKSLTKKRFVYTFDPLDLKNANSPFCSRQYALKALAKQTQHSVFWYNYDHYWHLHRQQESLLKAAFWLDYGNEHLSFTFFWSCRLTRNKQMAVPQAVCSKGVAEMSMVWSRSAKPVNAHPTGKLKSLSYKLYNCFTFLQIKGTFSAGVKEAVK